MHIYLQTKRLILRKPEESDLHAFAAAINSLRIVENSASTLWPYTADHALAYLDHARRAGPRCLRAIAVSKGSGAIIGGAIIESDIVGQEAEIGYWIAEAAWWRGFGYELAYALADHGFRVYGYDRLIANYFHGNEGSRRILVRLGFRHVRHSLEPVPGHMHKGLVGHLELTLREWLQAHRKGIGDSKN
jgi:RimJ/RimL family protein N-acetyltransferase